MAINIPDLPAASCRWFIACGKLARSETTAIEWLKKHEGYQIAKCRSHGQRVWIRSIFGRQVSGHCHIDVATRDVFDPERPPKATRSWVAVRKQLKQLIELRPKAVIEAEGHYDIPIDELPEMIKFTTMLFNSDKDGVAVKMSAGRLAVSGTPIYAITWILDEEEKAKTARVRIEARVATRIDEGYLVRIFDLLKTGLDSFIASGVPRG